MWHFLRRSETKQTIFQLTILYALYLIGWLLDSQFGFWGLRALTGFILLCYLPGFWLLRILRFDFTRWSAYGRIALTLLVSVAILTTIQFLAKKSIPFTSNYYSAILLVLNAGLAFLGIIQQVSLPALQTYRKRLITFRSQLFRPATLIALLPIFVYIVITIINPTVDDSDSYINLLRSAVRDQTVPLLARTSFLPLLGFVHLTTHANIVWLYKLFLPSVFAISTLLSYDYIRQRITSPILKAITYTSLLIAPVIMIETSIVRPQVLLLIYTVPFFIFLIEGWRQKSGLLLTIATWFAFLQLGYHELGSILLAYALAFDVAYGIDAIFVRKIFRPTNAHLLLAAIIVYPYTLLLPIGKLFEPSIRLASYAVQSPSGPRWQWWFIDSYTTVDGYNLGWTGIQAAYYYLYNGLLFILAFLAIVAIVLRLRKTSTRSLAWLIPFSYTIIYFVFAEIMPRMGYFFLPNRAWPHLMLGLYATLILYIASHQEQLKRYLKPLAVLFFGTAIIGTAASFYISAHAVGTVFPGELKAARYLAKQTDPGALVVSTQPNNDLISHYANREYTDVKAPAVTTEEELQKGLHEQLERLIAMGTKETIVPARRSVTQFFENDQLVGTESTVLSLPAVVPPRGQPTPEKGIYLIYSFAKLGGINGQRPYNKDRLDKVNEDFYRNLSSPNIVYRDKWTVILKVR